jgi:hypothetical protein
MVTAIAGSWSGRSCESLSGRDGADRTHAN